MKCPVQMSPITFVSRCGALSRSAPNCIGSRSPRRVRPSLACRRRQARARRRSLTPCGRTHRQFSFRVIEKIRAHDVRKAGCPRRPNGGRLTRVLLPFRHFRGRGGSPGQLARQRAPDGTPLRPLDDSTHDVGIHLKYMDIAGIDMAVLSGTEVGSLEEARGFHNHFAKVVEQHPKSFTAVATTLPLGGKPALDELERAVKKLGLKGVLMNAQVNGQPVDSRQLWPFYEKVSELRVPVFVHPSIKLEGFDACKAPYDLFRTIAREFDLSLPP